MYTYSWLTHGSMGDTRTALQSNYPPIKNKKKLMKKKRYTGRIQDSAAYETQRIHIIRGISAVTHSFPHSSSRCIKKLIGYCYLRVAGKLMTGSLRHFKIRRTKLIFMLMEIYNYN